MAVYSYRARDEAGKAVKGTMEVASKEDLVAKLGKMGYMVTEAGEAITGFKIESILENLKVIGTEDMIMFTMQLSDMINSGIPILTSLDVLSRQVENRKLRQATGDISRSVEGGDSLSQAMARHPSVFSGLFVSMVKAGEASGKLGNVLARFSQFIERQAEIKQKINGALFYPALLLCAGIAVLLFIVTFIIPQFVEIFTKSGIKLPLITLVLHGIGMWIKNFWYLALIFATALYLAVSAYINTPGGRIKFDRFRLGLPLLGALFRKSALSRFASTLATLTASGVPILQSLDITKEVMGNEILEAAVASARTSVETGQKLSEPLRVSGEFPPDIIQMIYVGEESGNLDDMLFKVAQIYNRSLDYTIKKLTTLLEPMLLLIMGAMVGFIMASMLLPIFDMVKMLRS